MGKLVAIMICKHEDKDDMYCMLVLVILVLVQSTFILVECFPEFRAPHNSGHIHQTFGTSTKGLLQ